MNEEQAFRKVIRKVIQQELDEATTTAAVPGYQTPFAFGDEDDEKKENDIEEFLDTYGWEMAELVKKAREQGLTESEREKVKQYISKVRSMRDSDIESYKKKSNYYPHNIEEQQLNEGRMENLNLLADKMKDMAIEAEIKTRGSRPQLYVGDFSPQHQVENLSFEGGDISGKVFGKTIRARDETEFAAQTAQALHDYGIRA